jgi:hypothetical protein
VKIKKDLPSSLSSLNLSPSDVDENKEEDEYTNSKSERTDGEDKRTNGEDKRTDGENKRVNGINGAESNRKPGLRLDLDNLTEDVNPYKTSSMIDDCVEKIVFTADN